MPNPFARVGQLKRTEDDIRDDLGIHLTNSISFGPCRTSNNGRVTNCHCVQNIRGDSVLQKNIHPKMSLRVQFVWCEESCFIHSGYCASGFYSITEEKEERDMVSWISSKGSIRWTRYSNIFLSKWDTETLLYWISEMEDTNRGDIVSDFKEAQKCRKYIHVFRL